MGQRNDGLGKRCGCREWSKCGHPWHFAYQWKGRRYRVSLDRLLGRPLRGKTDAQAEADRLRSAIRCGDYPPAESSTATRPEALTLAAYAAIFFERHSRARGKVSWRNDRVMLGKIAAFELPRIGRALGALSITSVTEDDCDVFLTALREKGLAASTRNKYLQTLKAMSAWGVRKGYLATPWILRGSDLKRETHAKRDRRLAPDEESTILAHAAPRLYRLIVAALETGCRLGELLSLQWHDVDLTRRELRIRAVHAKSRKVRHIPIVARLRAVLDMARHDPAGQPFGPAAHAFGDAVGHRLKSPKKAWATAVLKAHGHTPTWVKSSLALASRDAYRAIDLHFHDLRHEAGSRWLEKGMPLHHVKELLGHASISTTDTYLNASRIHLHESMVRMDTAGKSDTNVPHEAGKRARQAEKREGEIKPKSLLH